MTTEQGFADWSRIEELLTRSRGDGTETTLFRGFVCALITWKDRDFTLTVRQQVVYRLCSRVWLGDSVFLGSAPVVGAK